ncbi:MAG: hypothetical protein K6F32_07285 [Bacilli bacterium]|nr:hypothetical protein [Bacilli bacterium]
MEYKEFLDKLNAGEIVEAHFKIDGYGHYGHCKFTYTPNNTGDEDNLFLPLIELTKTKDGSEWCRFHKRFDGSHKIFAIKRMNYTLEAIWKRVVFCYIRYVDGKEEGTPDPVYR